MVDMIIVIMLNRIMKKITKMTKLEFDDLIKKHGYDHVKQLLVGDKKNTHIQDENGVMVISTLKKINRKRKIQALVKRERKLKKKAFLKKIRHKVNSVTEVNRLWFESLYKQHYSIESDFYNIPSRNRTIPNIVNKTFSYVVYVISSDEPLFSTKIIKYYKKLDYKLLTVMSNDTQSYIKLIQDLHIIRGHYSQPSVSFQEFLLTLNN